MKKINILTVVAFSFLALNGEASSLDKTSASPAQMMEFLKSDPALSKLNKETKREVQLNIVGGYQSRMRKRGNSEMTIFLTDEAEAFQNGIYKSANTLQEWMSEYNGVLVTNQTSFNYLDEWTPDFSTPDRALRSFWHARGICDAETILHNSDVSFTHFWGEEHKAPWLVGSPKAHYCDGVTKITTLLSGSCVLGGREYTMLFFRRESSIDPKSNQFSLQRQFFVSLYGKYYLTYDPLLSRFADIYKCLGMEDMATGGMYKNFVPKLKYTQVPQSFYLIGNEK